MNTRALAAGHVSLSVDDRSVSSGARVGTGRIFLRKLSADESFSLVFQCVLFMY